MIGIKKKYRHAVLRKFEEREITLILGIRTNHREEGTERMKGFLVGRDEGEYDNSFFGFFFPSPQLYF